MWKCAEQCTKKPGGHELIVGPAGGMQLSACPQNTVLKSNLLVPAFYSSMYILCYLIFLLITEKNT